MSNLPFDKKFSDQMKFYGWSNGRSDQLCQLAKEITQKHAIGAPTLLDNDDDVADKPCFELDIFDISSDDLMLEELRSQLDREKEQFESGIKDLKRASLIRNLKLIASACHKIRERLFDNSRNCNMANNNDIKNEFEKINGEFKRTLNDIIKCEPLKIVYTNKDPKLYEYNHKRNININSNDNNQCRINCVFVMFNTEGCNNTDAVYGRANVYTIIESSYTSNLVSLVL